MEKKQGTQYSIFFIFHNPTVFFNMFCPIKIITHPISSALSFSTSIVSSSSLSEELKSWFRFMSVPCALSPSAAGSPRAPPFEALSFPTVSFQLWCRPAEAGSLDKTTNREAAQGIE